MHRSIVVVSLAALAVALGVPPGRAAKARPVPCASARYVVRTGAEALVADTTPAPAVVAVQGNQVAVGTHCSLRRATIRATKKGTKVSGRWPSCGATFKSFQLVATIGTDCRTMSGVVKGKKLRPQSFTATKSTCPDGIVDPGNGEQCDGGGCAAGETCNASCRCEVLPVVTPPTTVPPTTAPGTTVTTTTTTSTTTTTTLDLCGNGDVDAGEDCDDGNDVVGDTCDPNCTFPGCGNAVRDPDETCDDGADQNGTPGDPCPASCQIAACNPVVGSHRAFDVSFAPPAGKSAAGVTVLLDYPEDRVVIPNGGGDPAVVASISLTPFGASSLPNDLEWALLEGVARGTAITPGRLFRVTFNDCQGAVPPAANELTCTVVDASDALGNVLAGVSCSVVAVP